MTGSTSKQSSLQATSESPVTSSRPRSNGPTHTVEGLYIKMEGLGLALGLIMTSDGFMSLTWAEQSDPNRLLQFTGCFTSCCSSQRHLSLAYFILVYFILVYFICVYFILFYFDWHILL